MILVFFHVGVGGDRATLVVIKELVPVTGGMSL